MSYLKIQSSRGNPFNITAATQTNFYLEVDVVEDCEDLTLTYKEARLFIWEKINGILKQTIQASIGDGKFIFNEVINLSGFYRYKIIMLDLTTEEETELMYGDFIAS